MGCQVSSDGRQFEKSDYDRLWKRMNSVSEAPAPKSRATQEKRERGWRILRIILVSTYKDFRNERQAVLDLVENKLQPFASEKQVFLQVEDFSWGSKAHLEEASCLYLIERLCREAVSSSSSTYFYLHFLGECSGYIIDHTFSDDNFLRQHGISADQSFSEVFLQLAGLKNHQSLFLYRNPSFLQELPFNVTNFIDAPANRERAKYLNSMVKGEVSSSKYVEYSVRTSGINNLHFKHILFDDLSGATKPVEQLINRYLEGLPDDDSTRPPSAEKLIEYYYMRQNCDRDTLQKIMSNIKARKSTLLLGDYCTGKTQLLYGVKKQISGAVIVQGKEGMSAVDMRRAIDAKTKVLHNINEKFSRVLLVDDVHLVSEEAQRYLTGSEELVIIATSRKKKIAVEMERITVSNMHQEYILEELSTALNCNQKEQVASVKASNILKLSQQKRRRSLGNVEDGHAADENVGWNRLKCQVIGNLGRLGSSEEKCAQLAQLSTLSVVEADVCLMEADGRGHLLIATLCFLTIVETGLNEIELRSLLIGEYNLLPIGIRRHFRNLPFEYCPDEFGTTKPTQIPPLRWYYIMHRLGHLLMKVDTDNNHFVLPSACRRVTMKKFLKQPNHLEHFKKHLRTFTETTSHCEWNRNKEIERFIS